MGSYIGKTPTELEMAGNEDEEDDLGFKLTVLRDAMIHLRVQFLHFQSFYKKEGPENIENDLKAMKIILMVVQNKIEDLKSTIPEYLEIKNIGMVKQKIEDFDLVVTEIVLEMKEFERDNFLMEKMEKLINKLNPFDVPNLETLDQDKELSPSVMMKTIMNTNAKKHQDKINKETIQNDVTFKNFLKFSQKSVFQEENEVRHDNSRILSGQRKIYKILRKPVVLFVNHLEEDITLKTLQVLNESQIDYSIFDVSTDSEVRLIVKYLSDCETFPQLFAKGNFEKLSDIDSLITSFPKLYVN
ncbi:hypothetical protein B9Z55_020590 [Caenorhabditis nigoni]|uniref:Glutaredoxin domain-containing protein n=1 Tax=Caenorhabditis nigoni TaxID=1611254 RepID=A0A2G5TNC2_9PELO|nr:hypothetical protein B9Z55_020590 [Caenorhabditis nigoni]